MKLKLKILKVLPVQNSTVSVVKTYYAMTKIKGTKRQTKVCNTLHRKLKIDQYEPH
jgi:hypothetical protein